MDDKMKLQISPRYVKEEKGLRPFQKETLDAIRTSDARIIIVEAPVGSGKSYILRRLLEIGESPRRPPVFIYPTKILMETQICALKEEMENLRIWPYEDFKEGSRNLFIYSTDSLVLYAKKKGIKEIKDRGKLIQKLMGDLNWHSKNGAIVTSPDVLYLLTIGAYSGSRSVLNQLQGCIFLFDEYHCYFGFKKFLPLVKDLLTSVANKIILLSATPLEDESLPELGREYSIKKIDFSSSLGTPEKGKEFNFPLEMEIHSFRYSRIDETEKRISSILPRLKKPCAVIFESIFRLQHIKRKLQISAPTGIKIIEWSGFVKHKKDTLDDKTIVLGTSAIEVGIDMKFKSLIFEAQYWPSAVQRLGRVGRMEPGNAILFTRKDLSPFIRDTKQWDRTVFEQEVLKRALNEPKKELGEGSTFRGESFNFILLDEDLKQVFFYNENLFAMYEITDSVNEWRSNNEEGKKQVLRDFGVKGNRIDEIILYDKIIPFWGLIRGRLRQDYQYLERKNVVAPRSGHNELSIRDYVFYGD